MNELINYTEKIFEDIKHIDEFDNEYWNARELQKALEYVEWRKFQLVIDKAKHACESSNYNVPNHFVDSDKTVKMPSKAKPKIIKDYKLTRYACYLIVQNADSRKKVISLGQTYFAIQTRKQELIEKNYNSLTEDEKRLYQRDLTRKGNFSLNLAARKAGVKNYDKFHNSGYKGLYNGETAADIAKRKKLRYREDILDNMGSDELAANLFRISQTKQKIEKDKIKEESTACDIHNKIGKNVRKFMVENGGIVPEKLITPEKSLKQIEKEIKTLNSPL